MAPWSSFRFRRGPLLQSVGLDGTETVAGLRQLDRSRRGTAAVSALDGALKGMPALMHGDAQCCAAHDSVCCNAGLSGLHCCMVMHSAVQHMTPCAAGLSGLDRQRYQRYKGPFLEQLGLADLQAQPRPWRLLLSASAAHSVCFNVPESAVMLQERVEENLVVYLVCLNQGECVGLQQPLKLISAALQANYLRLAALTALLSM